MFKQFLSSLLIFSLKTLIILSTFYTFFKGGIEYACLQERAGYNIHNAHAPGDFYNLTNSQTGGKAISIFPLGGGGCGLEAEGWRVIKNSENSYKVMGSDNGAYYTFVLIENDGLRNASFASFSGGGTHNSERDYKITNCSFKLGGFISIVECGIENRTRDSFLFYSLMLLGFVLFLHIVPLIEDSSKPVKRFIRSLQMKFGLETEFYRMCNPIDGMSYSIGPGESYHCLSDSGAAVNGDKSKCFMSKEVFISVSNGLVKMRFLKSSVVKSFRLSQTQIENLKCYFNFIMIEPRLCCVNKDLDHFVGFEDLFQNMERDNSLLIVVRISDKRFRCNGEEPSINLSKTFRNFLKTNLGNNKNLIYLILEHNRRFFSTKNGCVKSLSNVLNGKLFSNNKPSTCTCSKWKMYTSDFKHLMYHFKKLNTFSSTVFRPSKVCKEIMEYDLENIPLSFKDLEKEDTVSFEIIKESPVFGKLLSLPALKEGREAALSKSEKEKNLSKETSEKSADELKDLSERIKFIRDKCDSIALDRSKAASSSSESKNEDSNKDLSSNSLDPCGVKLVDTLSYKEALALGEAVGTNNKIDLQGRKKKEIQKILGNTTDKVMVFLKNNPGEDKRKMEACFELLKKKDNNQMIEIVNSVINIFRMKERDTQVEESGLKQGGKPRNLSVKDMKESIGGIKSELNNIRTKVNRAKKGLVEAKCADIFCENQFKILEGMIDDEISICPKDFIGVGLEIVYDKKSRKQSEKKKNKGDKKGVRGEVGAVRNKTTEIRSKEILEAENTLDNVVSRGKIKEVLLDNHGIKAKINQMDVKITKGMFEDCLTSRFSDFKSKYNLKTCRLKKTLTKIILNKVKNEVNNPLKKGGKTGRILWGLENRIVRSMVDGVMFYYGVSGEDAIREMDIEEWHLIESCTKGYSQLMKELEELDNILNTI